MHLKFLRAAATVAVLGGTATLGLGSTQAALASPTTVDVPCSTSTLIADMVTALSNNDTTLVLATDCTYWLHTTAPTYSTGLPPVMNTLTIVGSRSTWIKRSYQNGTPDFTIFDVGCTTGNLTLQDVNVKNGGGGSEDGGALAITNTSASATVEGGTFQDNNVSDTAYGGAIYNNGTLYVNGGATFTGNSADYGGAIYNERTMSVDEAIFAHNHANYYGGAIDTNSDYTVTVDDSIFSQNSAGDDEGGAIYTDGDNTTVTGGFFSKNYAYYGGAIYDGYDLTVNGGSYSQNKAEYGGAFYNGDTALTISHASLTRNGAYQGGGIYNGSEETLNVDHSAITYNVASHGGGGIYNDGGTVNLTDALVSNNFLFNCYPEASIAGCFG